jgi:magnesium-protoporphyrin O-methyltransferase
MGLLTFSINVTLDGCVGPPRGDRLYARLAGVGSLTFGLLERGVARAVAVDASSAYTAVAHQEAERLGRADVVRFVPADFVSVASELLAATLVTVDRVVCCYPSYESLLNAALSHAERVLALSYPRDVWYVRLGVTLENAQRRLTKNAFRTFVHPAARMEEVIRSAGFELSARHTTWMWSVDVYTRLTSHRPSAGPS